MTKTLDKDYVWECDYGVRKPLIPVLQKLLKEQDATSLQMLNIFVNNIAYNLELFIVVSYANPQEGHVETMKQELTELGVRYRPDITLNELVREQGNRRFDAQTLTRNTDVDILFESNFILWPEIDDLKELGYYFNKPLGKSVPVFLSHSSKDKPIIEDLIPYLNGAGLPVWFDKISIDYGESITEAIEKGIDESGAVIFWITRNFLNSSWCKTERRNFLNRHSAYNNILVISVISEDIDIKTEVPTFLRDLKACIYKKGDSLDNIAREIIPVLRRFIENY